MLYHLNLYKIAVNRCRSIVDPCPSRNPRPPGSWQNHRSAPVHLDEISSLIGFHHVSMFCELVRPEKRANKWNPNWFNLIFRRSLPVWVFRFRAQFALRLLGRVKARAKTPTRNHKGSRKFTSWLVDRPAWSGASLQVIKLVHVDKALSAGSFT